MYYKKWSKEIDLFVEEASFDGRGKENCLNKHAPHVESVKAESRKRKATDYYHLQIAHDISHAKSFMHVFFYNFESNFRAKNSKYHQFLCQ